MPKNKMVRHKYQMRNYIVFYIKKKKMEIDRPCDTYGQQYDFHNGIDVVT